MVGLEKQHIINIKIPIKNKTINILGKIFLINILACPVSRDVKTIGAASKVWNKIIPITNPDNKNCMFNNCTQNLSFKQTWELEFNSNSHGYHI